MRAPLTKLARASGALAMVAVDQREALRGMFAAHQSTPVPDSQLTQFKVDVARELSPFASALLVDQEFGIDEIINQKALKGSCGLIAAADLLVGPAGGAAHCHGAKRRWSPSRCTAAHAWKAVGESTGNDGRSSPSWAPH